MGWAEARKPTPIYCLYSVKKVAAVPSAFWISRAGRCLSSCAGTADGSLLVFGGTGSALQEKAGCAGQVGLSSFCLTRAGCDVDVAFPLCCRSSVGAWRVMQVLRQLPAL